MRSAGRCCAWSARVRPPEVGFLLGGFECASHVDAHGRRLDPLAVTRHDVMAAEDYRLLKRCRIGTVREGLRWATIEREPGRYDWSSVEPMLRDIAECGVAAVWDICHWGYPDWLDFFAPDFPAAMADFGAAAVEEMHRLGAPPAGIIPVNEVSFWSWAGGHMGFFPPFVKRNGDRVKRQLVRAFLAVSERLRPMLAGAPIIAGEPLVVVHPAPGYSRGRMRLEREGMHGAWEMLLGRREPELGGHEGAFDWIGVNWYPHNQWVIGGDGMMPLDDPRRARLRDLLIDVKTRYGRPILVTETGDEQPGCAAWLREVGSELMAARDAGVDVRGLCLYPATDYPGWADDRQCPTGVIAMDAEYRGRWLRRDVQAALLDIAEAAEARPVAAQVR